MSSWINHSNRDSALNAASFLIWLIGSILGRTWRLTIHSAPSVNIFDHHGRSTIYAFWHSRLLVASFVFRKTGKAAVVSSSKDGQIAAEVARKWGHDIIFGSSTRGGLAALRQCVKSLNKGISIAITPDGPRGPKEIVKQGVAQIAIMSACPVVPINVKAEKAWILKSWDNFIIPKPFSKVAITLGEPIFPPDSSGNDLEELISKVQNGLTC